ncbi:NACHT domain-containing protein [Amycolatopsis sp. NPDC051128]|uniref:NACHT domain-containing protein n=1 Tax=Amycolatopsis sp. NPDC051128 TaxID=3155412 RepID=UPI0034378089
MTNDVDGAVEPAAVRNQITGSQGTAIQLRDLKGDLYVNSTVFTHEYPGSLVDDLAEAVRKQWEGEAARRDLNDPYPLPIRWSPAPPELFSPWADLVQLATCGVGWPPATGAAGWARSAEELAGRDGELVDAWAKIPTGRLVVLGEPGSGKTILVVRLVLDLLAPGRRKTGDPVPVLLSMASWRPEAEGLASWLEARLIVDFPALARRAANTLDADRTTLARTLLERGQIIPILDGLDEMPASARRAAVAEVNRMIQPGRRIVLTSRTDAYRDVANPGFGTGVALTAAAGIRLDPLPGADAAAYLRRAAGGPSGAQRWDDVGAALTAGAGETAVSRGLGTPLMVALARALYDPGPGITAHAAPEPGELLGFSRPEQIEEHLFRGFVGAVYRPRAGAKRRWTAGQAEEWLGFLAHHLERDRRGAPGFGWWQLPGVFRTGSQRQTVLVLPVLLVALFAGGTTAVLYGMDGNGVTAGAQVAATAVVVGWVTQRFTGRAGAAVVAALLGWMAGWFTSGEISPLGVPGPGSVVVSLLAGLAAGLAASPTVVRPVGFPAVLEVVVAALPVYGLAEVASFRFDALGIMSPLTFSTLFAAAYFNALACALTAGLVTGLTLRIAAMPHTTSGRLDRHPVLAGGLAAVVFGASNGAAAATAQTISDGTITGWLGGPDRSPLSMGLANGAFDGLVAGVVVALCLILTGPRSTARGRLTAHPVVNGLLAGVLFGVIGQWAGRASDLSSVADCIAGFLVMGLPAGGGVGLATWLAAGIPIAGRQFGKSGILAGLVAGVTVGLAQLRVSSVAYGVVAGVAASVAVMASVGLAIRLKAGRLGGGGHRLSASLFGLAAGWFYAVNYDFTAACAIGVIVACSVDLARTLGMAGTPVSVLGFDWRKSVLGLVVGALSGISWGTIVGVRSGLFVGAPIGVAMGLLYAMEAPKRVDVVRSPRESLARDRAVFLAISGVIGICLATVVGFTESRGDAFMSVTGSLAAACSGLAAGVLVASAHTVWGGYCWRLCVLALRKRIPWSFASFLADAHAHHGVLRQDGSYYQFRHLGLQRSLSRTYAARNGHPDGRRDDGLA